MKLIKYIKDFKREKYYRIPTWRPDLLKKTFFSCNLPFQLTTEGKIKETEKKMNYLDFVREL